MKVLLGVLLAVLLMFSCGKSAEESPAETVSNDASIIFGNKEIAFPQLSAPAEEQAVHWGVLEDFLNEAKVANGSNYQSLRNHSERLLEYSDSLFKNVPDTLQTKPIHSRLVVLKTRSQQLFQASHRDRIDSAGVQQAMKEMNLAIENLIVHLNEKFQKDRIDLLRKEDEASELKKQERFKDSVLELERQDKNRQKV